MASPDARDVFIYLAEQEEIHQRHILEQIGRLDAGMKIDPAGLKGMPAGDRSAFFADSMKHMKDPGERELYVILQGWEQVHVRTLEAAYDEVKRRIWADNRFAPF